MDRISGAQPLAPRPLRVALVTPEYPDCGPSFGIGRYLHDLASGLRRTGHTVLVIAATDTGCWRVLDGGRPERFAVTSRHLLLRPILNRHSIESPLREFKADVIECSNWGALSAWLNATCPIVMRLSSSAGDPSFGTRGIRPWARLYQERRAVRLAHRIIADSHAMAMASIKIYGRQSHAVQWHSYCGLVSPLRDEANSNAQFLYVGRLEHRKGIDILLAAWPRVRASCPHARLNIVGTDLGGYSQAAVEMPGVQVHGRLNDLDLQTLRSKSAVQVIPSRFESFGLVALEAWAAGLAVVCTNAGGLTEVVAEAGIVVPMQNPHALAIGMLQALPNQVQLARLGQARLLANFDAGTWIAGTINQYRLAIGKYLASDTDRQADVTETPLLK